LPFRRPPPEVSALAFSALVLIRITLQAWDAATILTRLGSRRPAHGVSPLGGVARVAAVLTAQRPGHVACRASGSLRHGPLRFRARCAHWKVLSWDSAPLLSERWVSSWTATPPLAARERLPIDLDEDDVVRPRRAIHPDGGRDGSRPHVHALPDAAHRSAIPPAGRLLTLAFLEALDREDGHGVAAQPCSCSIHVIRLYSRRALTPRHGSHDAPVCVKTLGTPGPDRWELPGSTGGAPKPRA
jgi:hypothetical protein